MRALCPTHTGSGCALLFSRFLMLSGYHAVFYTAMGLKVDHSPMCDSVAVPRRSAVWLVIGPKRQWLRDPGP